MDGYAESCTRPDTATGQLSIGRYRRYLEKVHRTPNQCIVRFRERRSPDRPAPFSRTTRPETSLAAWLLGSVYPKRTTLPCSNRLCPRQCGEGETGRFSKRLAMERSVDIHSAAGSFSQMTCAVLENGAPALFTSGQYSGQRPPIG